MTAVKTMLAALSIIISSQFSFAGELMPDPSKLPGGETGETKVIFMRGGDLISTVENVSVGQDQARMIPAGNFGGKWRFVFKVIGDSKNGEYKNPRDWFPLYLEIQENGNELKGTILLQGNLQKQFCEKTPSDKGELNAKVDPENDKKATGTMKMCWDPREWKEIKIDLEPNPETGKVTGTATTYLQGDGTEHMYQFEIEKIEDPQFNQMTGDGPYDL